MGTVKVFIEKVGQAPPPSKDFHQLVVNEEEYGEHGELLSGEIKEGYRQTKRKFLGKILTTMHFYKAI